MGRNGRDLKTMNHSASENQGTVARAWRVVKPVGKVTVAVQVAEVVLPL